MSDEHHGDTHHGNYVKIWAILVGLLVISVLGPTLEIKIVTLITAFGIAVVKAYLVAKNFMHVNVQPKFIGYLMATCLIFMLLFFAGTAPDVMKEDGDNWIKLPLVQSAEMPSDHAPH
jgi:caa(3)-type oxidase subunit IV